jgi:hypothetical protein
MKSTVTAVVAACLLALAAASPATATTFGIEILTPLTMQVGQIVMRSGFRILPCDIAIAKELAPGLTLVNRFGLTRLGRIRAWQSLTCQAGVLGVPRSLQEGPPPVAPNWDISYLFSDLVTGELYFGILGFQISPGGPWAGCPYGGTVLGKISRDGTTLTWLSSTLTETSRLPFCDATLTISGTLTDTPAVVYRLLP